MAKSSEKENTKIISLKIVCGVFLGGALGLSLLAELLPEPAGRLISGPYGVFENMITMFYVSSLVFVGIFIRQKWQKKGWKRCGVLFLLSGVAALLIGEQYQWGIPWWVKDSESWNITTLQDLFVRGFKGVPEEADIKMTALVAGVRLAFVFGLVYSGLALYFWRERLLKNIKKIRRQEFGLYFVGFFVLSLTGLILDLNYPGFSSFKGFFEISAAFFYLMGVYGLKAIQAARTS